MTGDDANPIDPDAPGSSPRDPGSPPGGGSPGASGSGAEAPSDDRPTVGEVEGGPDGTDAEKRHAPSLTPVCDLCGSDMVEHHCKIVCPQCGYMRDCSDP